MRKPPTRRPAALRLTRAPTSANRRSLPVRWRRRAPTIAWAALLVVGLAGLGPTYACSPVEPFKVTAEQTVDLEPSGLRVVEVIFNAQTVQHMYRYATISYLEILFESDAELSVVSSDGIEPSFGHVFRPPIEICAEDGPCVLTFTVVGPEAASVVSVEAYAATEVDTALFASNRSYPDDARAEVVVEQ